MVSVRSAGSSRSAVTGLVVTVIFDVPFRVAYVALTSAVPAAFATMFPVGSTVTIVESVLDQMALDETSLFVPSAKTANA